jgi:hypothetical protein
VGIAAIVIVDGRKRVLFTEKMGAKKGIFGCFIVLSYFQFKGAALL